MKRTCARCGRMLEEGQEAFCGDMCRTTTFIMRRQSELLFAENRDWDEQDEYFEPVEAEHKGGSVVRAWTSDTAMHTTAPTGGESVADGADPSAANTLRNNAEQPEDD